MLSSLAGIHSWIAGTLPHVAMHLIPAGFLWGKSHSTHRLMSTTRGDGGSHGADMKQFLVKETFGIGSSFEEVALGPIYS